jgi:hypothetical protein
MRTCSTEGWQVERGHAGRPTAACGTGAAQCPRWGTVEPQRRPPKASSLVSGLGVWRARRDSNPQPSDPWVRKPRLIRYHQLVAVSVFDWLRAAPPRRTFSMMGSADAAQISGLGSVLVTRRSPLCRRSGRGRAGEAAAALDGLVVSSHNPSSGRPQQRC